MSTLTTTTSAKAWSPDVTAVAPADAVPDALVLQTSTVAGSVEGDEPAVRVQYVDDAGAGFVPEGQTISEAAPNLSEVLVYTGKIAQLIRLSREQFVQPNASTLLSQSVSRAITRAGNIAYLAQAAPTGGAVTPPAGLLNVSGLIDGGVVSDNLDVLVDLLATLAANYSNPSHILAAPTTWAALRKLKTGSSYNSSLLGAGTSDVVPMLLDLPVIVDNAVPAGAGVVVDKTAIVSAVGQVMVATSDQFYFNSDSVGVRCTWRFGQNIVRPDRIGVFYLDDGGLSFTVTTGGASSGNFTLTWRGRTTANIAYNATAATVKSALAALDDGYDASTWTVTGGTGGPWTVTVPGGGNLTGDGSGLTGGTFGVTAA
jgi:predicted phage gp36 major capsid-like protein